MKAVRLSRHLSPAQAPTSSKWERLTWWTPCLSPKQWWTPFENVRFSNAYLYSVFERSKSMDEHTTNLQKGFFLISGHQLKLKTTACEPFKNKVELLGHLVSSDGAKVYLKRPIAIRAAPALFHQCSLRSLLGLASYYQWFMIASVRRFAVLYTPRSRTELLLEWPIQRAFEKKKIKLSNPH